MSDVHQSKLSSSSTKEAKTEEGKTTIFTEENGYFGRKNRRRQSLIESIRNKLRGSTLPSNFQPVSKELLDFEELLLMNPSSFGQKAVTLPSFISQKDLEKFNSNYGAKTDKCTKKHNRDVRVNEISGLLIIVLQVILFISFVMWSTTFKRRKIRHLTSYHLNTYYTGNGRVHLW